MATNNSKNIDYLRQFRQMRYEGYTSSEIIKRVKSYRSRLDRLPSIMPGIDIAKQQADQFIQSHSEAP